MLASSGFLGPLEFQIIDDEVGPAISQVIPSLPARSGRILLNHAIPSMKKHRTKDKANQQSGFCGLISPAQ